MQSWKTRQTSGAEPGASVDCFQCRREPDDADSRRRNVWLCLGGHHHDLCVTEAANSSSSVISILSDDINVSALLVNWEYGETVECEVQMERWAGTAWAGTGMDINATCSDIGPDCLQLFASSECHKLYLSKASLHWLQYLNKMCILFTHIIYFLCNRIFI